MIRVGIVDEHPMVLAGIERALSAEQDLELGVVTTSVAKLIDHGRSVSDIDVIVVGTAADGEDLLQPLRLVRSATSDLERAPRLVLLAHQLDARQAVEAIKLGVHGTLLKPMPIHLLAKCIRKVAAGGRWVESESHASAIDHLIAEAENRLPTNHLSAREWEVLRLVAEGRKNREIASALDIAEGTVKTHVHNLCGKLNVASRVELARIAAKNRFI